MITLRFQLCVYNIVSARRHCPVHACLSIILEPVMCILPLLPVNYDISTLEISNFKTQALDKE